MAGGMGKGSGIPLAERVRVDPATGDPLPPPCPARHVTVTTAAGTVPALLLEWRKTGDTWRGRVVRPVLEGGHWTAVEEWLDADMLAPA